MELRIDFYPSPLSEWRVPKAGSLKVLRKQASGSQQESESQLLPRRKDQRVVCWEKNEDFQDKGERGKQKPCSIQESDFTEVLTLEEWPRSDELCV